ncbi:MAG: ParB N-terminal domain-containing protein [Chloroflexi bacterium]|nr:ParB N-terminal domain-containing protein [Chloroflexota bacterium]
MPEESFAVELAPLEALKPHPRNYRGHPDDQIAHIMASIQAHGVYRNVVIAQEGTILAGHGVVEACRRLGLNQVPVHRLPLAPDDPRALKVLAGDNEIEHLAEQDDRLLTELLREIKDQDAAGLLGTGYDEMMLANLVFVTRPESEIRDHGEAAQWVGMPEWATEPDPLKVTVNFANAEDRADFFQRLGARYTDQTDSIWWPLREIEDKSSLRFEEGGDA